MSTQTATTDPELEILHLSSVIRRPLVDGSGDRLGRVQDLIVRAGEAPHPPVVGLVVDIGGRDLFVPIRKVAAFEPGRVLFEGRRVDLRRFERRPGELLLARDLLAHHLINFVGGRLIRANEIELAKVNGTWEVVAVDPSSRPLLRRLIPGFRKRKAEPGSIVDWASIEPFVAHVPSSRLRIPYRKLAKLHPAQIADLVEAASHDEGEEIIEAVGADRELEADVFEELDTEHQLEFVRSRSDEEAARLLSSMAPDDAADLITEVDQERRLPILNLLPEPHQRKVRSLLSYNPETAGGLMSPDFLSMPADSTIAAAIEAVRTSSAPPESLNVVFGVDEHGRLVGSASTVRLIQADPTAPLRSIIDSEPVHMHPDWDLGAIVRTMSDFNLIVVPVLDLEHGEILGVVTVDDVMELLLPTGWRRDFGRTAVEE
ncbi:MAG TPA: CBS domain-containing protein [Acidimicrobiales bacterium]|jgi:CBS domain-containing protein|nr:CBS domain-containing protein [Acidimicrobiales bacterium]